MTFTFPKDQSAKGHSREEGLSPVPINYPKLYCSQIPPTLFCESFRIPIELGETIHLDIVHKIGALFYFNESFFQKRPQVAHNLHLTADGNFCCFSSTPSAVLLAVQATAGSTS